MEGAAAATLRAIATERKGGGRVGTELDAPRIGRIRVTVERVEGGIAVRLVVADEHVRQVLRNHLDDLRSLLRQSTGDVAIDLAHDGSQQERRERGQFDPAALETAPRHVSAVRKMAGSRPPSPSPSSVFYDVA